MAKKSATKNIKTNDIPDARQQILDFYEPSIDKMEAELGRLVEDNKAHPKKTTTSKIAEYQAEIARKKKENKATGAQLEQDNDRYLHFVQSTGGWHKLTGRSAVFFAGDVALRLKSKARYHLVADTDAYSPSILGVVSVKLTPALIDELKTIDIVPATTEVNDTKGVATYKLPYIYSKEEIDKLISAVNKDYEKLNALVAPKNNIPELYDYLKDITTVIYHNSRRMRDDFSRRALGEDLFEKSTNMMRHYLEAANGMAPLDASLKSILKNLYYIRFSLPTAAELRLITPEKLLEIGTKTTLIERMVKKLLRGEGV